MTNKDLADLIFPHITKTIEDSQIGVIFFTILFLGLWGGFRRDQVVNFLTLLWVIGMMVNSSRGKKVCTKKNYII